MATSLKKHLPVSSDGMIFPMDCPCTPDSEHTTSTIIYNTDDIFILTAV